MYKKKINRSLVLLLSVLLYASRLGALDPDKPVDHYLVSKWGTAQGLPADTVNAIVQTPDGFLWLGTNKGLFRFDGMTLEPIYFSDSPGGQSPYINTLLVAKDGGLWIGEKNNLIYLKDNQLQYVLKEGEKPASAISHIYQDSEASIWIATAGDYLFRFKDGKLTHFDHTNGVASSDVYDIQEDKNGYLWVADVAGGLLLYRNGIFVAYPLPIKRATPDDFYSVYSIYEDRRGVLWIGTNIGILGIADICTSRERVVAHFTPANGLSNNNVWSILEDDNGNLWVGTEKGINRIKRDPSGKVRIDSLMPDTIALNLLEDAEKNLWVGTIGSGLNQVRDSTFFTYWKDEGLPYWRLGLYTADNGHILAGSTLGDLFRFDKDKNVFSRLLQVGDSIESEIEALAEDRDGWLWLGTIGRGIWRVKNGKTIHYTYKNGLINNSILVIYRDARARLWIGYIDGGISIYRDGVFRHFPGHNGVKMGAVFVIREDKNKNIWIGHEKGLIMLPAGNIDAPDIKTYLPGITVTDIYEDAGGVYWIGTLTDGLKRFKQGNWVSFPWKNGPGDKGIYKILEDNRENFWIGTPDGILKISKAGLNDLAAGKTQHFQVTVFGSADGMLDTTCRPAANNSAIKTNDGELWFGTRRGIAVVNPEKVYINKYPPPVVIKEAIFNYEPVSLEMPGKSFTGIKDLLFRFTVPTFSSQGRVKMKYWLQGYDKDWILVEPFSRRQAHYKNVPPGLYRFQVIACNSSGLWNKTGASFAFVLKSYFYQTPLFKIAAFITGLLLIIALYCGLKKFLYYRKLRNKYQHSTLDAQKAETCLRELQHLMETKKFYRDENLTLDALAKELSIAPRYLSQIINEQLNRNFRDYLNEYRIEEAKAFLTRHGKNNHKILGIAFEVGFNSKEVFNRSFKKYTGTTPSRYLKEHNGNGGEKRVEPMARRNGE